MNFELTPQQKAVQQSARQFAQTVLQETVLEDDAAGRFPEEAYKKMGEMGFVGLPFPKEYGLRRYKRNYSRWVCPRPFSRRA